MPDFEAWIYPVSMLFTHKKGQPCTQWCLRSYKTGQDNRISNCLIRYSWLCTEECVHDWVSVLWEHDCRCFLCSKPLEGAHITSLWAWERHMLYKYTPLKGLWGTLYTHTRPHTPTHAHNHTHYKAVHPLLPIKSSNGCLCFYLIAADLKTMLFKSKTSKNTLYFHKPLLLLTFLFHSALLCVFDQQNEYNLSLVKGFWEARVALLEYHNKVCCFSSHNSPHVLRKFCYKTIKSGTDALFVSLCPTCFSPSVCIHTHLCTCYVHAVDAWLYKSFGICTFRLLAPCFGSMFSIFIQYSSNGQSSVRHAQIRKHTHTHPHKHTGVWANAHICIHFKVESFSVSMVFRDTMSSPHLAPGI